MIDKQLLKQTVEDAIAGTDVFLVDIAISAANEIAVEIDSAQGIDIDTCAAITRKIEQTFDRDIEDYELEVGSAGLTSPFKVKAQYIKNIGNKVEALTDDGRKLRGVLKAVNDNGTFVLTTQAKVKSPGEKRPHIEETDITLAPEQCKYVKYDIDFK